MVDETYSPEPKKAWAKAQMLAAEKTLLEAAKRGEIAYISDKKPAFFVPWLWPPEHKIRAQFLRHLLIHPDLYTLDPKGFDIRGAHITGEMDLESLTIPYPLVFGWCQFDRAPQFRNARTRTLSFHACHLPGLAADGLWVEGALFLRDSTCTEEIRLLEATVKGGISCTGATFSHPDQDAFSADKISVGGTISFNGAKIIGAARLLGATVKGNVDGTAATFSHPDQDAFSADRIAVGGNISFNGAKIIGAARLLGATVKGNVDGTDATFSHPDQDAFSADRIAVGGNIFFNGAKITGAARLLGATVKGDISCTGATFINPRGFAFQAQRLTVGGRLFWTEMNPAPQGDVDFTHTHIGDFLDDEQSWPEAGKLILEGLVYDSIDAQIPVKKRMAWLDLMPKLWGDKPAFWPQPYEQVIRVLRTGGHEHDARRVGIAKQDAYRRYLWAKARCKESGAYKIGDGLLLQQLWLFFIKHTIGFGYKPWRALGWLTAVVVLGAGVFAFAHQAHYMHVAKERVYLDKAYLASKVLPPEYPRFNAWAYSVGSLIPFVDLHQENYWEPKSDGLWGGFLRLYFWLHIAAGWVLATIAAAGLAGVIKKD